MYTYFVGLYFFKKSVLVNDVFRSYHDPSPKTLLMRRWKKNYKTLFKESVESTSTEHTLFSETCSLPILKKNKEILLWEEDLTENDFYEANDE